MAIKSDEIVPLYMHTIYRTLREMRLEQQDSDINFDYGKFKTRIMESGLMPTQMTPLIQRLDTLESFMPKSAYRLSKKKAKSKAGTSFREDNTWGSKVSWFSSYFPENVLTSIAWTIDDC